MCYKEILDKLELFRLKKCNEDNILEILQLLIPINEFYQVSSVIGDFSYPIYFMPKEKQINISIEKLDHLMNKMVEETSNFYTSLSKNDLYAYFLLLALSHECEHVKQYLIANNYIDFPYKIIRDTYKNVYYFKGNKNFLTIPMQFIRYCYVTSDYKFLLERNANIEAINLLNYVSQYEYNKQIKDFFNMQTLHYLTLGYDKKYNGSVEEAYKKLGMYSLYNEFPKNENILPEERVRYGLPIDDITKSKVLKYEFKIW